MAVITLTFGDLPAKLDITVVRNNVEAIFSTFPLNELVVIVKFLQ